MYPLMQRPGPRCADCGAHVDDVDLRWNGDMRSGYWVCADDDAGCAARVAQRADALVARVEATMTKDVTEMPRDGETLGALRFDAVADAWIYDASYSDVTLARRRAVSLSQSFGVPFRVISNAVDGSFACVDSEHTAALRAVLTPSAIWPEDEAAHVAETVDELRREDGR